MKSELSFLMDLFLSDDVPPPFKKLVAKRIREVEGAFVAAPQPPTIPHPMLNPVQFIAGGPQSQSQQSPSMQRIMAAHPDVPVVAAAPATPAAAEALAKRAAIINGREREKPEAGRSSPRKF